MISFAIASLVFVSILSSSRAFAFSHHPSAQQRFSNVHSRSDASPCHFGSLTQIKMSSNSPSNEDSLNVRYLGSGEDAIIRPGVVLLAPTHEYDHYLMRSAVFVYAIGTDENENTMVRGVVIDHPSAFTIGEMSPNIMGTVSNNLLFRGGYDGSDSAMLLHSAGGPDGPVKSDTMIGTSGLYEGGIVSAMESVDAGVIGINQCKFFFNYMQFTEMELDNMFAGVEDGDTWVSLEIPPEYVLDSDYSRGQLWSKLRSKVKKIRDLESMDNQYG